MPSPELQPMQSTVAEVVPSPPPPPPPPHPKKNPVVFDLRRMCCLAGCYSTQEKN